jgi:predicted ATPase
MITKIEVDGYRLLHDFRADLGELTVVVGRNATGKSTLLDFLKFLSQVADRPVNSALRERGGMVSVLSAVSECNAVRWRIQLTWPRNNPVWVTYWPPSDPEPEFVYEAALTSVPHYGAMPQLESLRAINPAATNQAPLDLLQHAQGVAVVYDSRARQLVPFYPPPSTEQKELFSSGTPDAGAGPARRTANAGANAFFEMGAEGPALLLAQVRFPATFYEVSLLRALLCSVALYSGFSVGQDAPLRYQPSDVEPTTLLMPRGDNLPGVLHTLLATREYGEWAERLKDFLRVAYQEEFLDLTAEPAYGAKGKVALLWHENGMEHRPMYTIDLSDGVLRFLCLAAALNNPRPPALILIDEPEAGLHPGLLPIVADMLKAAAEQTQVLVTTHSPDLVNYLPLDDVAVMIREQNRIRWFRPSSRPTLRKLLESVEGETLGDLHRSGELEAIG